MNTPTKFLIALVLVVGCSDPEVGSSTSQVSTGSTGDSTGDEAGSTSDDSSSSSSEGSSTGSTGAESTSGDSSSGVPVDPDPQPGAGHMWGPCHETTMLSCPAMSCLVYDQWNGEGYCTRDCTSVKGCGSGDDLLSTGATLVCESIYPNSLKYCLLACEEDAQCPVGMACKQLPNADPDSLVQTVCA